MTTHMVTLQVPEPIYQRLRERAAQRQRSIEEEAGEALVGAVSDKVLPDDLEAAIAPLTLLSDDELWQAGRVRLSEEAQTQLEALHFKQQSGGLSATETATEAVLLQQYKRVMLIRAQAAALLTERGHDVSGLLARV